MALIARLRSVHRPAKNVDTPSVKANDVEQQSSSFARDRIWARLFARKRDKGQLVPALSSIIKAGDEGVYSSALLNGMHGHSCDISLEMLYDAFGDELKSRPLAEQSSYPSSLWPLLSTSRPSPSLQRGQSLRVPTKEGRFESPSRMKRTSLDMGGLGRSRSRKPAPMLVSMFNALSEEDQTKTQTTTLSWANDSQHAQYLEGMTGIIVTVGELTALSLILGCPLSLSDQSMSLSGKGAFGISISRSIMADGKYHVSLKQHNRSVSQLSTRGSGYSTLFAKHMASGSLPYSQDETSIHSILITADTLEAIKAGTSLQLQQSDQQTPAYKFLASLPSSRTPALKTLIPLPSSTSPESPTLLINAIASLPFSGGLTPLASAPLIQTIHFVTSAGLPTGRLLQRLDALVEKVHRHSPSLNIFGPLFEPGNAALLFRERERLGRLATGADTTDIDSIADKAARVQRYITLIERLMSLVPGLTPTQVLTAVREATHSEIQCSHDAALAAHSNSDAEDTILEMDLLPRKNKRHSTLSVRRAKRLSSSSFASRSSVTFPVRNLGSDVEGLLKLNLPLDVPSIARLVRFVIVAWTISVGEVDVERVQPFGLVQPKMLFT